jgi:hypothetical protein
MHVDWHKTAYRDITSLCVEDGLFHLKQLMRVLEVCPELQEPSLTYEV